MREVIINGKLVDVKDNEYEGFTFTSPIFRDFSSILSNKSTTIKIPKTDNNRTIFGLTDHPDIISDFPYQYHTYKEYRDGLLFIDGRCALLKITDDSFEIAVSYGTGLGLLSLKDRKLRELEDENTPTSGLDYISIEPFLLSSSKSQAGFIIMDFGTGIENVHPSVTIEYIVSLITKHTGVEFSYPDNYKALFSRTWIPLIDKYANELIWKNYRALVSLSIYSPSGVMWFLLAVISGNPNIIANDGLIKGKADSTVVVEGLGAIIVNVPSAANNSKIKIYAIDTSGNVLAEQIFDVIDNKSQGALKLEIELSEDTDLRLLIQYYNGTIWTGLGNATMDPLGNKINVTIEHKYVRLEDKLDKYPVVPNLPDLTIEEFVKILMNMFGLFTYYKYNVSNGIEAEKISLIPISEIYDMKDESNNYTDKLLNTNNGRFKLSFTYGSYAKKNRFKYKNDSDVTINADGSLIVNNETLEAEKDIYEVPFSPSESIFHESAGTIARINRYEKQEDDTIKENSPGYRILNETTYYNLVDEQFYKAGVFDDTLHFSGNNGLINAYYNEFQAIINHPVVVECYVYLKGAELYNFSELTPVYIDGVYYMLLKATVQNDGVATLQLIKMPTVK